MNKDEITKLVIKLVADQTCTLPDEVEAESTLDDLCVDSIDRVELVMMFEDEFDIEICDSDFYEINAVQELIDYVQKRLSE